MAELEKSLEQLPNLAEKLKLNIGSANELHQEITRLSNIQGQLENTKKEIEDELGFQKAKNAAMRALPFLGTVASIFIPGGFLIDAALIGGGFIADKFGNPEEEITLQDLQLKIEDWIEWCSSLTEIAQDILNNSELLSHIKSCQLKSSVCEQVKSIHACIEIKLDFSNYHVLKQNLEKIANAQKQLAELQKQVNYITSAIENSEDIVGILFGLTSFFGNCDFALDWLDDEYGLILSSNSEFISLGDIFNECENFKEKIRNLILQINTLRGQVEQNLKSLEQEQKRNKSADSYVTYQGNNQSKPSLPGKEQATKKITKLKPFILIITSTLVALGFNSWIGKEKFSPEQKMSLISNQQEDHAANFKAAQTLAMEAAILVQKAPHPPNIWKQAEAKWQQSIKILENIPEGLPISTDAKNKLTAYRLNHKAINTKLMAEQRAEKNWENAQNLAMKAAILVQNPPHPQETWQQAKVKWEQSINLLETIPEGTFYSQKAKDRIVSYRNNYVAISTKVK
jgi:hypothetical protein